MLALESERWLVHVCAEGKTKFQIEYLTDVAVVEANRLKHGLYCHREGTDAEPEWLMADFHRAITEARSLVENALASESDEERKVGLIAMKPALSGNADSAWENWHRG